MALTSYNKTKDLPLDLMDEKEIEFKDESSVKNLLSSMKAKSDEVLDAECQIDELTGHYHIEYAKARSIQI